MVPDHPNANASPKMIGMDLWYNSVIPQMLKQSLNY